MSDALTAAGVAPQEPNQNETKSGNNFVSGAPSEAQWDFGSSCLWCDPDHRGPSYSEFKHGQRHALLAAGVDAFIHQQASYAAFDRWLAEVRREAAEKALTDAADELALLNDGGKRGLAGHSKSSASAITHRHAVAVIRARAEAYRRDETE